MAELKLMFKEGGAFEFYNTYTSLLDRLQAQDAEGVEHLEDLPVYSSHGSGNIVDTPSVGDGLPPLMNPPDDLPPTYDDATAEEGPRGGARNEAT